MHNVIYTSLDGICPVKTYYVEDHKPDWLNNEIKSNIKLKKKLLKKARKTKLDEDWDRFRIQRSLTSDLIRKTKANIVRTKLNQNQANQKKILGNDK